MARACDRHPSVHGGPRTRDSLQSLGKLSISQASLSQNNATSCRTSVQNVDLWGTIQIRIPTAAVNTLPHTQMCWKQVCTLMLLDARDQGPGVDRAGSFQKGFFSASGIHLSPGSTLA